MCLVEWFVFSLKVELQTGRSEILISAVCNKANLPYILWVAAVNTTFILAFVLLDMYYFPVSATKSKKAQTSRLTVPDKIPDISGASPAVQASLLLEAINKN